MVTIEELLISMQKPKPKPEVTKISGLMNTKDTWRRIGKQDSFSELGLSGTELSSFLADWVAENPYNNI